MTNKLHILFLSSWYPNRVSGNVGDFIKRHAEAVALKHKVSLLYIKEDEKISAFELKKEIINNVHSTIIYIPKYKNSISKYYFTFKAYLNEIQKIQNIDLIHLNITYPIGVIGLYSFLIFNIPYIISEHWSNYQFPLNKSIGFFQKKISKLIIKKAKCVCPVTHHLKNEMIQFGLKGNYSVVPNVVDTSLFTCQSTKNENFVITHISDMNDSIKNVSGLIEAIGKIQNKIPNLKFQLIGNNSKQYISNLQKRNINNYEIYDFVSHDEIPKYLRKSHLFVLFSNYENLPCVIIEALSCGVPVISSNVGGISEYFNNELGLLVKPNNSNELKKAILQVYENYEIYDSSKIRQFAKDYFSKQVISDSFSNIYNICLK